MAFIGSSLVFLVIVGVIVFAMFIGIYNRLISLSKQVDRAWANIDVILKQRYDELPQLIQVIEQYTQYEKRVIDQLVQARSRYGSANTVGEKIATSGELSVALKGIFAIGENYPDLKSNQNFLQLQSRISSLEESLADRREFYNDSVTLFNTRIEQFPDVFFANMLAYKSKDLFRVAEAEKIRPDLKIHTPA